MRTHGETLLWLHGFVTCAFMVSLIAAVPSAAQILFGLAVALATVAIVLFRRLEKEG